MTRSSRYYSSNVVSYNTSNFFSTSSYGYELKKHDYFSSSKSYSQLTGEGTLTSASDAEAEQSVKSKDEYSTISRNASKSKIAASSHTIRPNLINESAYEHGEKVGKSITLIFTKIYL